MRLDRLVEPITAGPTPPEACREQDPVHDEIAIGQLKPNSALHEASGVDLDVADILDKPFLDRVA